MRSLFLAVALCAASPALAEPAADPPAAQIDPARLELARITIDSVWPLGTYQRMMGSAMDQMMSSMMSGMFDLKLGDMVQTEGKAMTEEDKKIAQTTMREAMLKADPHFEERLRISNKVMMTEMGAVFSKIEPSVREGLAAAYARKFDAAQLGDLNAFFATSTGKIYARESLMLYMDPEMMKAMTGAMPELMKSMPSILQKVEKATAHLPKPPKAEKTEDSDEENGDDQKPTA